MKLELVSSGVLSLLISCVVSSEKVAVAGHGALSSSSGEPVVGAGIDDTQTASSGERESLNSYFPWTHKPVCTGYLDGVGDKLCVYTNATFSNRRGISIFTTPRIAKEFASLPPFQDPAALSAQGINP